jgi:hypothetical protein
VALGRGDVLGESDLCMLTLVAVDDSTSAQTCTLPFHGMLASPPSLLVQTLLPPWLSLAIAVRRLRSLSEACHRSLGGAKRLKLGIPH